MISEGTCSCLRVVQRFFCRRIPDALWFATNSVFAACSDRLEPWPPCSPAVPLLLAGSAYFYFATGRLQDSFAFRAVDPPPPRPRFSEPTPVGFTLVCSKGFEHISSLVYSAKQLVKGEPNVSYICSRYYRAPELIFGATNYSTSIGVPWCFVGVCQGICQVIRIPQVRMFSLARAVFFFDPRVLGNQPLCVVRYLVVGLRFRGAVDRTAPVPRGEFRGPVGGDHQSSRNSESGGD